MSLTDAHLPTTVKVASPASISYLVTLLEERTEDTIDPAAFENFSQQTVSDMIEAALEREALPATPEQLAEVARLAAVLGRGTIVTKDASQASRQIRSMQADLDARSKGKRVVTPERKSAANELLDGILGGNNTPEVVDLRTPVAAEASDDIPF